MKVIKGNFKQEEEQMTVDEILTDFAEVIKDSEYDEVLILCRSSETEQSVLAGNVNVTDTILMLECTKASIILQCITPDTGTVH